MRKTGLFVAMAVLGVVFTVTGCNGQNSENSNLTEEEMQEIGEELNSINDKLVESLEKVME